MNMAIRDTAITPAEFHAKATRASISDAASFLQDLLSQRLVAFIVGKDSKTVSRWVKGGSAEIRDEETERRLRTAYEIAILLLAHDSPQTVRAWFISMNPNLDDTSPAEALHDGDLKEVIAAARAFVVGA
jgi:hypothetical protein